MLANKNSYRRGLFSEEIAFTITDINPILADRPKNLSGTSWGGIPAIGHVDIGRALSVGLNDVGRDVGGLRRTDYIHLDTSIHLAVPLTGRIPFWIAEKAALGHGITRGAPECPGRRVRPHWDST